MDPREPLPSAEVEHRREVTRLSHHLIQSIIQELPYPYGSTARADSVWWKLNDIDEENGLYPMEFDSVFDIFVRHYNGGVQ